MIVFLKGAVVDCFPEKNELIANKYLVGIEELALPLTLLTHVHKSAVHI